MPWIGSLVTLPGSLTGHIGTITKVRDFDSANRVTRITVRVTDPPVGGTVVVKLHDQADGLGLSQQATILDGDTFATAVISLVTGGSLWQEIDVADGDAMNFSGEYDMASVSGVTDFFTTLDIVKRDLNITTADTDRDTVLTQMILGVTRLMQDWMSRDIVQGTTTQKIDTNGKDTIHTKHWPITNITTLSENGVALVEDDDFESNADDSESGEIIRLASGDPTSWGRARRGVEVTYDHGYLAVPDSLENAATTLVIAKYMETKRGPGGWRGMMAKGIDPNASVSFDKDIWKRETIPAMSPYRRLVA